MFQVYMRTAVDSYSEAKHLTTVDSPEAAQDLVAALNRGEIPVMDQGGVSIGEFELQIERLRDCWAFVISGDFTPTP